MVEQSSFTTRDGRTVAYGWFGAADGHPVVHCHGSAESRLFEVDPTWTASRGVRVITPDRPGFGASDVRAGRSLIDWADDAEDLLRELGVERCSLLGWSGGGPHALATASRLPQVDAVAVVAAPAPVDLAPAVRDGLTPTMQFVVDAVADDPAGASAMVGQVAEAWVGDPDAFITSGKLCPADQHVYDDDVWGGNLRDQILEGLRQTDGMAADTAVIYRDWGFDPGALEVPVSVWHGGQDGVVPVVAARWLAERIPGARLHELADDGHFLIYSRWHEIIDELLAAATR